MDQTKKMSLNADPASLKQTFVDLVVKESKKKLNILVTGKTGVGKSRLVNGLVGRPVAKEGRMRDPCTVAETPYTVIIEDITVIVWDSRGLQDGTNNDKLYLANLKDINSKHGFDIVIYCLRMDDTKFYPADKNAIRMLTGGLGKDLWKKAVMALTFANKIEDPDGGDEPAFFMNEMSEWKRQIDGLLTELKIDCQVRSNLPVVPAGNYKKLHLPTCNNWLSELWTSCYCVMDDKPGLALYLLNMHRLRFPGSTATEAAIPSQSEDEAALSESDIPKVIPLNEEQENRFWKRMRQVIAGTTGLAVLAGLGITVLRCLVR